MPSRVSSCGVVQWLLLSVTVFVFFSSFCDSSFRITDLSVQSTDKRQQGITAIRVPDSCDCCCMYDSVVPLHLICFQINANCSSCVFPCYGNNSLSCEGAPEFCVHNLNLIFHLFGSGFLSCLALSFLVHVPSPIDVNSL